VGVRVSLGALGKLRKRPRAVDVACRDSRAD
jgi:hypothetical protein